MSQSIQVTEVTNEAQRCELGEGPHWDVNSKSLYYVDITAPAIFRYDTKNGEIYKATIKDNDLPLGFIIPIENTTDEFIVGAGRELTVIKWDGKSGQANALKVILTVDRDISANRINDAKCDPFGRLYFGTMGDENSDLRNNPSGSLFRYDQGKFINLKSSIGISNGLTWNEKLGKFYYIDSVTRDVKVFDYDSSSGIICEWIQFNRHLLYYLIYYF
jgi:sugar lactone lactonase YvrE